MISQNEAAVFVLLGMSLMFFSSLAAKQLFAFYDKVKLEYAYMKHPRLIEYSMLRACEDPHKWREVVLALRGLPVGKYTICTECGSIIGQDAFMCSDQVLQQVKEGVELMDKKAELQRQVNDRIEGLRSAYVDHYIKRNFSQEVNDIHLAEKLRALGRYSVTALADATEKVASELTAQTDLDKRYEAWPSKLKGNA